MQLTHTHLGDHGVGGVVVDPEVSVQTHGIGVVRVAPTAGHSPHRPADVALRQSGVAAKVVGSQATRRRPHHHQAKGRHGGVVCDEAELMLIPSEVLINNMLPSYRTSFITLNIPIKDFECFNCISGSSGINFNFC